MENWNEINGALSLVGTCENFTSDYAKVNLVNLFFHPQIAGAILKSEHPEHKENGYLTTRISVPSFIHLKTIIDKIDGIPLPDEASPLIDHDPFYKVANNIFSYFKNEPILGFFDQYLADMQLLTASVVVKQENNILCTEIGVGDLLYMSLAFNLPIYINKDVINKHGKEFEHIIKI